LLFDKDPAEYKKFLVEPFFANTEAKSGRKRDTTNKFISVSRYLFNANTREKDKTINVYANVASYYAENQIHPDDIPKRILADGGLKAIARHAAQVKKAKAAIFEDETSGDFVALKIWVARKHLDRAMKMEKDRVANLKIQRVEGATQYKEFVCKKFKLSS
jgi:hypothetical protein